MKEDGAIGLFRGAGPTVVRAMALNMGMLASNDEVRLHSLSLPCMGSAWVVRGDLWRRAMST